MNRILILFAHPALEKSRVQRRLAREARTIPGVRLHDLYEEYPDFMIDVAREQRLLGEADIILFQHPVYWYSAPALLKEWQDLVLENGFAYGRNGHALHGKITANIVSTGGGFESYQRTGSNRFTLFELLAPFNQTAHYCGMCYLPPFVVHGAITLNKSEIMHQSQHYRELLIRLQKEVPSVQKAEQLAYLNDWLHEE